MPATTWMPLYASDFLSSTMDMTQTQIGAYIRLLCYAWENGGLPNDLEACGRIAGGLTPSDWKVIRRRLVVLDEGTSEERLSHPRMEAERAKCQQKYDSKCAAAAKARASRSVSNPVSNVDDNLVSKVDNNPVSNPVIRLQPEPEPEPEQEPIQKQDDSPSSSAAPQTQGNLRPTPQKRRRSYRIGWSVDGGFTGISAQDRKVWGEAYPGVNLTAELAKAHVYLRENPAKAGKRNWGAFLARWFARVQDKGGSQQQAAKPGSRWETGRYWRVEFNRSMTEAEYAAALRGLGGRQRAERGPGGVSVLSDVIARVNASQEAQNEDYPN